MAYHRADLVQYTVPGNPAFDQRYYGAIQMLIQRGHSATEAAKTAIAMVQGGITKQAAMLAYNDSWLLILLSFLAVIPAVFLLHRPSGRSGAAVDAH